MAGGDESVVRGDDSGGAHPALRRKLSHRRQAKGRTERPLIDLRSELYLDLNDQRYLLPGFNAYQRHRQLYRFTGLNSATAQEQTV
jgi:hypothetical protein